MSLVSMLKKKNFRQLFTTPSHSGKLCILHKFYNWYKADISEVDAYNPQTELENSEKKASKIYNVKSTCYLTNGSTSGVIASVLASCSRGDKILIWEKSHPCHKNGATLAGAEIVTYSLPYNAYWGIYEALEPDYLKSLLEKHRPKALIVTTPSYEGVVSDVVAISKLCREYETYFIADEAHGALYPFCDELPESAVKYADFTVQSLHKTAGGLNPTALVHCNCNVDIKKFTDMIVTTSPSYPMLASIEANINYLNSQKGRQKIRELTTVLKDFKSEFKNIDFYPGDVTKMLIKKQGLTGFELSKLLYKKYNIEDERTNEKSTLLLTGLGTTKEKLLKLRKALIKIDKSNY